MAESATVTLLALASKAAPFGLPNIIHKVSFALDQVTWQDHLGTSTTNST